VIDELMNWHIANLLVLDLELVSTNFKCSTFNEHEKLYLQKIEVFEILKNAIS